MARRTLTWLEKPGPILAHLIDRVALRVTPVLVPLVALVPVIGIMLLFVALATLEQFTDLALRDLQGVPAIFTTLALGAYAAIAINACLVVAMAVHRRLFVTEMPMAARWCVAMLAMGLIASGHLVFYRHLTTDPFERHIWPNYVTALVGAPLVMVAVLVGSSPLFVVRQSPRTWIERGLVSVRRRRRRAVAVEQVFGLVFVLMTLVSALSPTFWFGALDRLFSTLGLLHVSGSIALIVTSRTIAFAWRSQTRLNPDGSLDGKRAALSVIGARPILVTSIVTFGLVMAPITWAFFGGVDNRLVRGLPESADQPDRESITVALREYDKEMGPNAPIVIVAMEGGGIFAAAKAMIVHSLLQEATLGAYWRHTFAVSGVSGGSIGTAAFWSFERVSAEKKLGPGAYMGDDPDELGDTFLMRQSAKVATADFLSPILFRLAFGSDLLLDRSRALDQRLVDVAADASGDPSVRGFLRSGLASGSSHPHLVFNTTSASLGDRLLLTDLKMLTVRTLANSRAGSSKAPDLTVADAACVSARFPLITSSARVAVPGGEDRLVDGGFYDNSGIQTAIDIAREIRQAERSKVGTPGGPPTPRRIMLVVCGETPKLQGYPVSHPPKNTWLGDALAPLTASAAQLYYKNAEASRELHRLAEDNSLGIRFAYFDWSGQAIRAPLAWVMDERRSMAMAWMLGSNKWYVPEQGQFVDLSEKWIESVKPAPFTSIAAGESNTLATRREVLTSIRAGNREAIKKVMAFLGSGTVTNMKIQSEINKADDGPGH